MRKRKKSSLKLMRDKMEDYSHKPTRWLELEMHAMIKNHMDEIEKAFKMAYTLYKRTNDHRAENAKHHLAQALSELAYAEKWADAYEEKKELAFA